MNQHVIDLHRRRVLDQLVEIVCAHCEPQVKGTLKVREDDRRFSLPTFGCGIIEERRTRFMKLFTRKERVMFAEFRVYATPEQFRIFSCHLFSFNKNNVELVRESLIRYRDALHVDEVTFTYFEGWASMKQEIL